MRVTTIPAQVTTVEDRILGNLSFSQMALVITPIFLSAGLFAVLPPAMGSSSYKYIVMGIIITLSCLLAMRIKGKILALWLVTLLRYYLRRQCYLFNKNVSSLRQDYTDKLQEQSVSDTTPCIDYPRTPKLSLADTAYILEAIDNPAAKVRFETNKRGGLYVRLTEIEE